MTTEERRVALAGAFKAVGYDVISLVAIVLTPQGLCTVLGLDWAAVPSVDPYQAGVRLAESLWGGVMHAGPRLGGDAPCTFYRSGVRFREKHGPAEGGAPPIELGPVEQWAAHQWAAGWVYADTLEGVQQAHKGTREAERRAAEAERAAHFAAGEAERFRATAELVARERLDDAQEALATIGELRRKLEAAEDRARAAEQRTRRDNGR